MYPIWNPYYSSFMMPVPQMFPFITPQMFVSPVPLVTPNQNFLNNTLYPPQAIKNNEKNTEHPTKKFIQISSDSQSKIQQADPPQNHSQKEPFIKKHKNDRFLGFKQGIFLKDNNSPTKSTMNLRKKVVLTRARLRKHKRKNIHQKSKEKNKKIQSTLKQKKVKLSSRLSKQDNSDTNKILDKKPRNKQFGRLKKYLKCVGKTVDLPSMYTLQSNFLKIIAQKRENLMLRKVE